ncbi:methyl-CpG-binding domain-containing protein 9 isoform X2 [Argentina anserina]|uniref:methyl-CpG-binding domain-containing protein 9 isoform X2 n=1 Tax=Argentina anserina TaxID=57926 RepID=UPI0021764755|nr:methyl-CpG-binding domain-containing protein 9 isoform X2 [Potentilla anserina]
METTDLTPDELRDSERTGAGLDIDLNERIPSPETLPDSVDVVRYYHDNPSPPPGGPAGVPGGAGRGSACASCGKPEVRGHVVVCDGCERGFHLACAGMRGRQAVNLDEWVCGECMCGGVRSKRWPLGVKSKQILDINASPPSDGDGEADVAEGVMELRNGFGLNKASGISTQAVKYEDILHHTETASGRFDEVEMSFPVGRHRRSNNTAIRVSSPNSNDIVLQALRDFVSERHGVLEEGWRVEFKQSIDSSEPYLVYCAPNGKTFDSLSEVAYHLGLTSGNSMGSEVRKEGSLPMIEKTYQPRKRKSKGLSANGVTEIKESLEISACGFVNNGEHTEVGSKGLGCIGPQHNSEGLPVQFEDFFVLSLGEVDKRPSYHDSNLIWPIGYRSCWHDRITGSLFICEVLDGGDSGPVFMIRRCSCSALLIPSGSTILSRQALGDFCTQSDQDSHDTYGNDASIHMILSDPSPMENDVFSCLTGCSDDASDVQTTFQLQFDTHSVCEQSESCLSIDSAARDDIGEILVEDHSSSSAWESMSRKIVNACSELYKQRGAIKFCCKHQNASEFHNRVVTNDSSQVNHTLLDRFCSLPGSDSVPSISQSGDESGACDDISKWLDHDRFGLDVDFVQELLEQLPGAQYCSQYQFLRDRSNSSTLLTVGNGVLVVKMGAGLHGKEEEVLDVLYRRPKKAKLAGVQIKNDRPPPLGKPLCLRIPPALVGDLYQVWEILWRFHGILGLKEAFSLSELEDELISPWFASSDLPEKYESEIQGTKALKAHKVDCRNDLVLSSSSKSASPVSKENPHAFIHMETGATKEAAQAKIASVTYNRCSGIALTKAHASLLRVLIGDLQYKVAALVDPNFESGEFKSKRGRKKDIDCSIPVKRSKLLPINELTWPELARRYLLAVIAMDGNLDSAEITGRESGKVFRCLQGDGGVLCGSLTGVAGMEADALFLADATKKIFASLNGETHVFTIEEEESDGTVSVETNLGNDGNIPVWAQMLEPVRKLPTNVGTRIRKCVYEALEKDPPEWAKKILEHSISKEVYKGNASGPTKKAVISLLADVLAEALKQKSEKGKKRKINVSISDVIMKKCRIVFRRAAAADDTRVFCNLLGRKLMNPSDNDDEGLLGSPAMVSRPLDFRTIDLRLAAGSYGGSHEAFSEDVRQLWSNLRIAYGDQPDLVELVETLSQSFETLYEEVVSLDHKFSEYAKLETITAESKKEIDDLVASTSDLPKAPWDEGVCKVCGIDKDDDSVLLCDTCDAEYHTYCLIPPLARIPKGNWYCPSCVVGKNMVQDVLGHPHVISRRRGKHFQGEVTRVYLESLTHLAVKMEDIEYWEFHVDERTFLLKFLCDELLNLGVTHQHIDHCSETSIELQQKLRSLSVEWKNLKSREEFLVARAAKVDVSLGKDCIKEGSSASVENQEKCFGHTHAFSGRSNSNIVLDGMPASESALGFDKLPSVSNAEYNSQNSVIAEIRQKDGYPAVQDANGEANSIQHMHSEKNDRSLGNTELTLSDSLSHEANGSIREIGCLDLQQEDVERVVSSFQPSDQEGLCMPPHMSAINDSHSDNLELNSVRNDLSLLLESIAAVESDLSKVSVRREFLGIDSLGGLYWASAMPGEHSRIIVDRSVSMQQGVKMAEHRDPVWRNSISQNFAATSMKSDLPLEGSKAHCPFSFEPNNAVALTSPWVSYQTDAEIDDLIGWLKPHDPKEKELRESLLHWQKSRFVKYQQTGSRVLDDLPKALSVANGEKAAMSNHLVTRAAMFLEKIYGQSFELENVDTIEKQEKRARLTNDEKMHRCDCLEPIWPCRHHCFSCHKTYMTDLELEGHNGGRCTSGTAASEKGKEISGPPIVKGSLNHVINREDGRGELTNGETSRSVGSELDANLIRFQNDGLVCPYDLEEICSKFVTDDSNRELIQEIGLIGSKGIPSFVPSISPYLSDSAVALITQRDVCELANGEKAAEAPSSEGNTGAGTAGFNGHSGLGDGAEVPKASFKRPGQKNMRPSGTLSSVGVGHYCVVPQTSLRPIVGKVSKISRKLKINLLDMEAALPEEAVRPSKAQLERRWAWRAFVKSASTIFEMVQATIVLEDMIKTEYLRNEWWYWSSYSAAARTSTMSSLSLRIYSLDAAILYEKLLPNSDNTDDLEPNSILDQNVVPVVDSTEKLRISKKVNKKRKEPEG